MAAVSETHPPEENLIQMISLTGIIILLVFYSDITTPLGLMTWILYFIPLFLTLYIRWQYGPFVVAGTAIIFIGISFFISPRDMSEFYALVNRIFFSFMLLVSALLIWRHKKSERLIQVSEERYQNMIESSPEAIFIIRGREIQYINPSGVELCEIESGIAEGSDCMSLFDPVDQERITSTIAKATEGAKVELPGVRIGHKKDENRMADIWIGEILWDGTPAIQLIIRTRNQ